MIFVDFAGAGVSRDSGSDPLDLSRDKPAPKLKSLLS